MERVRSFHRSNKGVHIDTWELNKSNHIMYLLQNSIVVYAKRIPEKCQHVKVSFELFCRFNNHATICGLKTILMLHIRFMLVILTRIQKQLLTTISFACIIDISRCGDSYTQVTIHNNNLGREVGHAIR